jgi:hypothetical protein
MHREVVTYDFNPVFNFNFVPIVGICQAGPD